MSDAVTRLNAALSGRYAIERELGEGVWQATAPEEPLLVGDDDDVPGELSPDGRVLAFYREAAGTARDIWTMPVDGGQAAPY